MRLRGVPHSGERGRPVACTLARRICTGLHTTAEGREAPVKICTDVTMSHVSPGHDDVLWARPDPVSEGGPSVSTIEQRLDVPSHLGPAVSAPAAPATSAPAAGRQIPADPEQLRALPAAALEDLARTLRRRLVEICSEHGGHLGPNLGVVELTLALHREFRSPQEPIVFDTGHQAYRSEEHTSELQSRENLVCRLLLEKKKQR